jgi:tRNA A37 threonylcarbamoyladenosine biosynthesis protein TsaE
LSPRTLVSPTPSITNANAVYTFSGHVGAGTHYFRATFGGMPPNGPIYSPIFAKVSISSYGSSVHYG